MTAKRGRESASGPCPPRDAAVDAQRPPTGPAAASAFQEAEMWQRTFDAMPDLIAVLDTQHRIVRVNEAMMERLGMAKDQCVGRTCYSCVHGTDGPPSFCPHSQLLQDGLERTTEVREESLGGDFLVSVSPLRDSAGRLLGSVHVARDITERKQTEEALRRAERIQAEAEKLAATGRMAAQVAHEINNPLAGIKNSFRLIRDAVPKDHPDRDMVGRIEREIDRVGHVVRQLYELYSPHSQMPADIPVGQTVYDVLEMLEPLAHEHEVAIEVEPIAAAVTVWAPQSSLQQLLYNLAANAIQASRRGGSVKISACLADNEDIKISIHDRGHGIPIELRDRVFEPFFSADVAGYAKKGLGLGLSIVKSVVGSVGGRIEFESEVGEGACFHVYLPSKEP
jgi:PAS domain S-box-containing protein